MKKIIKNFNLIDYIPRVIACWLYMVIVINNVIKNDNVLVSILVFVTCFIFYSFLNNKSKKIHIDSIIMLFNYIICSLIWLNNFNLIENNMQYLISIIVFLIFIIIFTVNKNKNLFKIYIDNKSLKLLTYLIVSIPTIILITIGVLRYITFNSPNFDFGIFSHIFHYMKDSFIPYSTCERDMLLSHFAVHFSPILYVILPIYFIFSSPITLQVLQALLLCSGIIPLIKLCKHYKLSNKIIVLVSILYCFYPALSTGTFYDFHENAFLPLLLLWIFYFFEKKKNIPLYIFTLLTLMVKEDAALYLIIFSLYLLISRKKYKTGFKILIVSLLYFLVVTYFMKKFGLGIMSDRYENLIFDNSGLVGAIKTILLNPGYVLTQLLSNPSNNFDKIVYLFKLFMPVMFIPFITKKTSRYILLVPILINILTNYVYMYDINFHYSYGILAFIFYLLILNIKDMNKDKLIIFSTLSIIITFICYYSFVIPTFKNNILDYKYNKENYKLIKKTLNAIPKDKSVSSSTFYLPHLTNRKELYEIYYHGNKTDIDYVVLDMRYKDELDSLEYYLNNGYKIVIEEKDIISILKK